VTIILDMALTGMEPTSGKGQRWPNFTFIRSTLPLTCCPLQSDLAPCVVVPNMSKSAVDKDAGVS